MDDVSLYDQESQQIRSKAHPGAEYGFALALAEEERSVSGRRRGPREPSVAERQQFDGDGSKRSPYPKNAEGREPQFEIPNEHF